MALVGQNGVIPERRLHEILPTQLALSARLVFASVRLKYAKKITLVLQTKHLHNCIKCFLCILVFYDLF